MAGTDCYGLLDDPKVEKLDKLPEGCMNVFDATIDALAECFGDLWGLVRSVRPLHAMGAVALAYIVMFSLGLLCAL